VQLELEKVQRTCNDLQDIIERGKCAQNIVQDKFQNAEQQNRILEREVNKFFVFISFLSFTTLYKFKTHFECIL
jgi:hypothetical protein